MTTGDHHATGRPSTVAHPRYHRRYHRRRHIGRPDDATTTILVTSATYPVAAMLVPPSAAPIDHRGPPCDRSSIDRRPLTVPSTVPPPTGARLPPTHQRNDTQQSDSTNTPVRDRPGPPGSPAAPPMTIGDDAASSAIRTIAERSPASHRTTGRRHYDDSRRQRDAPSGSDAGTTIGVTD